MSTSGSSLDSLYEQANKSESLETSEPILKKILASSEDDANSIATKEKAIYKLGELYAVNRKATELKDLLTQSRPFFNQLAKAKTSHVVLTLISLVSQIPNTLDLQVQLCEESIQWAQQTKLVFLRQKIEAKMAALYLETEAYAKALKLLQSLLSEVKRFDDKQLLVEIQLIESRVQHKLQNIPKAKASLTSARTAANAIYCPPFLQAQIDIQSGTLHAEEHDYKTAYSYFYESFEGFVTILKDKKKLKNRKEAKTGAINALKYMLLCKIMLGNVGDVYQIITGKGSVVKGGVASMEAMKEVANASKNRSLKEFDAARQKWRQELEADSLISSKFGELEDKLLEGNLTRIIEPFSCVEIGHVAELIGLPLDKVERKLSQMILDKKLHGILDQGADTLIIFDEPEADKTYPAALETIQNMSTVVDSLYEKAKKLRY
eukprot:TRINITY_DN18370_c0_g1_i1.p1 TRINITY_DN18370_c0_g1~~TRINITY_DN18370_c0_g1_i1.p1  ORF type:complete len:435 (-),score=99.87 TRINITY_DN18370_c0_g1_i1:50-1354(-)